MPRDLFGDVTRSSISIGNRKWYTVPVSLLSHSVVIAGFVVLPILAAPYMPGVVAEAMPDYIKIIDPPAPPPIKPKQPDLAPPANPNAAPTQAPEGIKKELDRPDEFTPFDIPVGTIPGDVEHVLAPPPVIAKAPVVEPVKIGGTIRQPLKVHNVDPVYPTLAQAARVQGIVIIEATLSPDGQVSNARILRSIPLLDQAALEAVRQWQYTPTLLNGVPVPVIMTITVMFTLSK
jgi:periplasmic protein TonB